MISRKEESIHEPAGIQKKFGLLCLLTAAIALLMLSGTQAATQEPEAHYSVLYNFCSQPNCADGGSPQAGVIRDEDGNLYGTTLGGGSAGAGVVFKLDRKGKYTVLYGFTGGADGNGPTGVIRDKAGNFYGTTRYGGNGSSCRTGIGCGVVFKLDGSGNETVLYSFTGGADGAFPSGLIRDEAGNLYGTAGAGAYNAGVVFKLDGSGNETVLYSFTGGADGAFAGSLIRDEGGNLYGPTSGGGNLSCFGSGCGVVFKLDPSGKETVLYTFMGLADGAFPNGPLVRDAAGSLYGTTASGGNLSSLCIDDNNGCGVVFKLDRWGKFTVLYTFTGAADGASPFGGLTPGDDDLWNRAGNLYGTTANGGNVSPPLCGPFFPVGCGVAFRLDRWGEETVLHTFNGTDGAFPLGVLLKHHGSLYGIAGFGGAHGGGVVFKIKLDDDDHVHESDH